MGSLLLLIPFAYALLQIHALWRWRGGWRLAALVPLAVVLPLAVVAGASLQQGSNLWPLPLLLGSAPAALALLLTAAVRRTRGTTH